MASQGHIKIDRRILNWEWYRDSNMVHVFLHLLLNANYADGRFQGVLVKRGQLIVGRLKLAMALGLTERQIRTCLNKLKMTNEISIQTTNKFSIVTICKYDSYQSSQLKSDQQNDPQSDKLTPNKRPTKDQQATTIKEEKESKEEKVLVGEPTIPNVISIDKRKEDFGSKLAEFKESYSRDMLISFYEYWIEPNKSKTKMRFEMEKTWDLSLRLKKWSRNNFGIKKEVIKANQPYL
jgi:hypothetical protein